MYDVTFVFNRNQLMYVVFLKYHDCIYTIMILYYYFIIISYIQGVPHKVKFTPQKLLLITVFHMTNLSLTN